jgi:hypothetical protein
MDHVRHSQEGILRREGGSTSSRKWILLSPARAIVPATFGVRQADTVRRDKLLAEMQRFRGRVYLDDGAIRTRQLTDGRHRADEDEYSWHLLAVDQDDRVCGCVRHYICAEDTGFSQLNISRSALASSVEFGKKLELAVESELALSRRLNLPCVEIGGWALAPEVRGTTTAIRMALAMYSLSQELGGSIGMSTATRRHCSASILRRIGGQSFEYAGEKLPAYKDSQFECDMELLRFYSWAPNPRYAVWIEEIREQLRTIPVLTGGSQTPAVASHADLRWPALVASNAAASA